MCVYIYALTYIHIGMHIYICECVRIYIDVYTKISSFNRPLQINHPSPFSPAGKKGIFSGYSVSIVSTEQSHLVPMPVGAGCNSQMRLQLKGI